MSLVYLWFFIRGVPWRAGVAAVTVECGDALEETATVCGGGFVAEGGRPFEVEDAEGGEVVLNQSVDGSHGCPAIARRR